MAVRAGGGGCWGQFHYVWWCLPLLSRFTADVGVWRVHYVSSCPIFLLFIDVSRARIIHLSSLLLSPVLFTTPGDAGPVMWTDNLYMLFTFNRIGLQVLYDHVTINPSDETQVITFESDVTDVPSSDTAEWVSAHHCLFKHLGITSVFTPVLHFEICIGCPQTLADKQSSWTTKKHINTSYSKRWHHSEQHQPVFQCRPPPCEVGQGTASLLFISNGAIILLEQNMFGSHYASAAIEYIHWL